MSAVKLSEERLFELVATAKKARESAYAPYSEFPVGAALLMEDASVTLGCNVENSSFSLTICAERNAMAAAIVKDREKKPVAIAIVGKDGYLCPPCGACRQFLMEFNPEMLVILEDKAGIVTFELSELCI